MKNMLRASGLVTVLALTALSTASAQVSGTCRTRCNTGSVPFTSVYRTTTQSECCSVTYNPCPPGSTLVYSTWTPYYGGVAQVCG